MSVSLHHIQLQVPKDLLPQLKAFYLQLFDLKEGPRPAFKSHGFWLYSAAQPLIHINQSEDTSLRRTSQTTLDHVAFSCQNLAAMLAKLEQMQVAYQCKDVPPLLGVETGQKQVFIHDPAGNRLELNFEITG